MRRTGAVVLLVVVIAASISGVMVWYFLAQERARMDMLSFYMLYMQLIHKPGYVEFYDYDANQQLNAEPVKFKFTLKYTVYNVSFDTISRTDVSSRVTGYLVKPSYPREGVGVILIHGLGGSKDDMLPTAEYFAVNNFTCLAIDLPLHGERAKPAT